MDVHIELLKDLPTPGVPVIMMFGFVRILSMAAGCCGAEICISANEQRHAYAYH